MQPLLSVVIPTRNRQFYAENLVDTILSYGQQDELEIIIQDNSDENYLENVFNDKWSQTNNVFYEYSNRLMSTLDNFSCGIDNSTGEYICCIGDDDVVMPSMLEIVKKGKAQSIEAISWKMNFAYKWPSDENPHEGHVYTHSILKGIRTVNAKKELNDFVKAGLVYYLNHQLPKLYHGVVKSTTLKQIKQKIGSYFCGLSVDVNISVLLAQVVEDFWYLDYPLSVSGSSPIASKTHDTKEARELTLDNAPHFKGLPNYIWNNRVPRVYSVETIWAESSIQALEAMDNKKLIDKIDLYRLASLVILRNPQHKKSIHENYSKSLKEQWGISSSLILSCTTLYILIFVFLKKVFGKINRTIRGDKVYYYYDIKNIQEATAFLVKNYPIEKYLSSIKRG